MKQTPLADILRKIRPLALHHQAAYLRSHIAVESGGNVHKTSVRIRELQAALHDVTMRRLKREGKAA
jgi:hypothetical protein